MKTYIFRAQLQQEADGRWSAWVEELPGCAAWGYTRAEAEQALRDAVTIYLEDMLEAGECPLPPQGQEPVSPPSGETGEGARRVRPPDGKPGPEIPRS